MYKNNHAPFKFDIVGSFLRPDYLKEAREQLKKGDITEEQLRKVEDQAIQELIDKQKKAGLPVITDGEFRRSWWHLDFMWGLQGVEKLEVTQGYTFHDEVTRGESAGLCGKISGENHPFIEHFKYVKLFEDSSVLARQTIPAPAQFLAELERGDNLEKTRAWYPDEEALLQDIAAAYRQVIRIFMTPDAGTYSLMTVRGACFAIQNTGKHARKGKRRLKIWQPDMSGLITLL